MATTLRHVAELAGVSVKTVSNVIHDHPHVSTDVRGRVEQAIRQLDYRPDLAARALRTGRSGLLALAVPGRDAPDPPGLVDEIVRHASRRGYRIVIEPLGPAERSAGRFRVDAVLLTAGTVPPELIDPHVPLVVLGGSPDPRYDCVTVDATRAARDATDHLVRAGRRRIAAIGAYPGEAHGPPQPHTAGYREAIHRAGLRPPVGYLRATARQRHADGYHATRGLLAHEQRPDAIFCYHDRLAAGAIRAATDAGLRVPEDLAVIGIGDSPEGRYSRPTLTTVAADPGVIARAALDLLTRRLAGSSGAPRQIVVPHVVLARESTARP